MSEGMTGNVALICARGGSKGLPGKNVKPLGGRPLIAWSVGHARAVSRVRRVLVSTDDEAIADAARDAGAEVPFMRPSALAQDDTPEWSVWQHALRHLEATEGHLPRALVVLPATSPLRAVDDVERCLDVFESGDFDIVVTVTASHRSPYFNMVHVAENGRASIVMGGAGPVTRRQDAPPVFDMTTVAYIARPEFVLASRNMFEGRVGAVQVPTERAWDIDTPLDFEIVEGLMARHGGLV